MGLPGGPELLIVLVIVMLVFGASRLPKLARSMGQAGKEFKAGLKEGYTETDEEAEETTGS
jgi:sec-independent protein translocase protein TatA